MQKKKWIFLALLLVVPGLMFSVSCQKKLVDASPAPMAKEEPKPEPKPEPAPAPTAYKAPGVIMQEDIYLNLINPL
jgi:hypothetical protein